MANLATDLLRTTVRFFYPTEHVLVIDALVIHSTLPDSDLAHVLGMQPKALRKLCGRLKEDGLLSVQARAERRMDAPTSFYGGGAGGQPGKERVTHKDWYYLNFHRAIDSIKYRMHKLNKHIESLGAPSTEKKDLSCPRCKAQWTELEVMDRIDFSTGQFLCQRCGHALDHVQEDERLNENESMKRFNSQLEKIQRLMQQIDSTTVPENDFQTALSKQRPVVRLEIKPEKIAVQLQNDEDVKRANREAEEQARREKEARQNALPDWIAKSTVSGEITSVGAKEEQLRKEREAQSVLAKAEEEEERKPAVNGDEDVMAQYWEELAKAQKKEAADLAAEEEEEEDEDEFEDVAVSGNATPAVANEAIASGNGTAPASTGFSTPAVESSNATDDEREAKRPKTEEPVKETTGEAKKPEEVEKVAESTPAASDEDEDELEFENV